MQAQIHIVKYWGAIKYTNFFCLYADKTQILAWNFTAAQIELEAKLKKCSSLLMTDSSTIVFIIYLFVLKYFSFFMTASCNNTLNLFKFYFSLNFDSTDYYELSCKQKVQRMSNDATNTMFLNTEIRVLQK